MIEIVPLGSIKIVGQETGKVYASGTRADCFRKLHKEYQYKKGSKAGELGHVYPEPLMVVKY